ncbi:hypothetical protein KFL_012000010 [Klebsormidium nitens]|uniref:Ubiquitin-like protease family profile domain-containing protein n=1 Tax=Klebsormidium nitens TaxID=105231 RepID=A0A1Y1IPR9_KLENI|nr:hypothetical protein KFL_012000010 [Klebsormidium nitens]|eukprot:GAQ92915.1 hypothetical protein KFL_012000010 [Klebsormidium nitens]
MAPSRKTDQTTLDIAESMREVVRQRILVDEHTGAPPLWHDLPAELQRGIEKELRSLAKQRGVDFLGKGGLRRKAQKYVQTLHERGRKVTKGKADPDYQQIIDSRREKRKFVEVDFTERPRKMSKADTAAPSMSAPSPQLQVHPAAPSSAARSPQPQLQTAPVCSPSPSAHENLFPDCPSPHFFEGDPSSPAPSPAAVRRRLVIGQSPARPAAPVSHSSGCAPQYSMSAIKELIEALPEVTFSASDTSCKFELGMVVRYHELGWAQNDLYESEHLLSYTVTVKEDWSQVIDVQDKIATMALQPSEKKSCLLRRILEGVNRAHREKEEAKWLTPEEVLVFDSFFLKRVAEEFGIAEKSSTRRVHAPMEEILRFARVARRQLSVDDLFSYRYWLLPFCDRLHWSLLILVNEKGLVHGSSPRFGCIESGSERGRSETASFLSSRLRPCPAPKL